MKNPHRSKEKIFIIFHIIVLSLAGIFWINFQEINNKANIPRKSDLSRFSPLNLNPKYRELLALQASFIQNARDLKPLVVSINSLIKVNDLTVGHEGRHSNTNSLFNYLKDWLTNIFEHRYAVESLGSGLIWDSYGHIVTNYHVIKDTESLFVHILKGDEFQARVLGVDVMTDLAVLKIFSWADFPSAPIGKTSELKVGEWVMAIGNPYGLEGTVTVGVISGRNGIRPNGWNYLRYIQTDNSINPGNSGGPLINLKGKVIGINTVSDGLGLGLGLTLPIETVYKVVSQLIENGKMDWSWVGISAQTLTPELAKSFDLSDVSGALINAVESESPASLGGLKQGDIIIQYNGQIIDGFEVLQNQVLNTLIGQKIPIKIIRNSLAKTLFIEIGIRDADRYSFQNDDDSSKLI